MAADLCLHSMPPGGLREGARASLGWIPFNEGWGQFESMQVVRWLRNHGGDRASDALELLIFHIFDSKSTYLSKIEERKQTWRGWINMASGWNDVADLFPGLDAGDLLDAHNYESPPCAPSS